MRIAGRHRGQPRYAAARGAVVLGVSLWSAGGRADQRCDTTLYPLSTPISRFEDHADGTVTDRQSNLMWMRCSAGQAWSAGHCTGDAAELTFPAAEAAAKAINQSGQFFFKDWRLPRLPELASIAERQCKDPRINLSIFPGTSATAYWTATSRASDGTATDAYTLSFGAEGVNDAQRTETHELRLVRTAP